MKWISILILSASYVSHGHVFAAYTEQDLRSVETDKETKLREVRQLKVKELQTALSRRQPKDRRADLYFRLAETYLDMYRSDYILEGKVFEKQIEKGYKPKGIDHGRSKPILHSGIKASQEVIDLKIPYEHLDRVYYFLGFYYGELGNTEKSAQNYQILTGRYPRSPLAFEGYRELGDYSLNKNQFKKAQGFYEQALRSAKATSDQAPILHKLAWALYRQKQYDQAISTMKQAIESASGNERYLSIREEALRDMAVFMTERGRAEEALDYFKGVAGDSSFYQKTLERLASEYERKAEPEKAIKVYESIIQINKDESARLRALAKVIEIELKRKKYTQVVQRISKVEIPKVGGDEELQQAVQNLRGMVRGTATKNHDLYRKAKDGDKDKEDLKISEMFYTAYLSYFLSKEDPRKEIPEIQMYLAEVKRELDKPDQAADLYQKVVKSGDERFQDKANALWVDTLGLSLKKSGAKKNAGGKPSAIEMEFVRASDLLLETKGDSNETREASLRSAQLLAGYSETKEDAFERSEKIVERWPTSAQAVTAARLQLQIMSDRLPDAKNSNSETYIDRSKELKKVVDRLKENSKLMQADKTHSKGELGKQIDDLNNKIQIGTIAAYEKDKDYQAAGKEYENFAKKPDKPEVVETALNNALHAYMKSGDSDSMNRVLDTWGKKFPKSKKFQDIGKTIATQLFIQGEYKKSAVQFEKMGRTGDDAGSLLTAARIYEGIGDGDKARDLLKEYLRVYPAAENKWDITLNLANSYVRSGDKESATKTFSICQNAPSDVAAECATRLADLYLELRYADEARKSFQTAAGQSEGKPKKSKAVASLSPFVGYARFRLAQNLEKEGVFEPMALPEARLKTGLEQRLNFIKRLGSAYLEAVQAGGPWGVAALHALARRAIQFADEIDAIQPPAGAKAEAITKFKSDLKGISDPLRVKAITTWKEAHQKATENDILSPVMIDVTDGLADFKVSSPMRAQGSNGGFKIAGLATNGGSKGKDDALEEVRKTLSVKPNDQSAWLNYGNLLWGDKKPLLAHIAYERVLSLNPKSEGALNNMGVLLLAEEGEEDWVGAAKAMDLFDRALGIEKFFTPAKVNRAMLLNYYRLFQKAKTHWDQVLVKVQTPDVYDGMAISLFGLGKINDAESFFSQADAAGGEEKRFTRLFHQAIKASVQGPKGAQQCLDLLDKIDEGDLRGFEKKAYDHLERTCKAWKA